MIGSLGGMSWAPVHTAGDREGQPSRVRSHGSCALVSSDPPPEQPWSSVLVVDDDEDFRQLLTRLLREGKSRRIDQASSVAEAKASLVQRPYDVVITDLSMPQEGGLSLMQWSQEH